MCNIDKKDPKILRSQYQHNPNRFVSRVDIMMNDDLNAITGVQLQYGDTCDRSLNETKGFGDLRFLERVPTYKMIMQEGDCINKVDVVYNQDTIENLHFFTINGKNHVMGKFLELTDENDKSQFLEFGKDSCLVGISLATGENHKAKRIKFFYQEFEVENLALNNDPERLDF